MCSIEGCDRVPYARTWCKPHYQKWLSHGTTAGNPKVKIVGACSLDGCARPIYCRGWCEVHYNRWRSHGDAQADVRFKSGVVTYEAIHYRLRLTRGRASDYSCRCGSPAGSWAYNHGDPDELTSLRGCPYSLVLDNYVAMCVPCHKRFDLGRKAA